MTGRKLANRPKKRKTPKKRKLDTYSCSDHLETYKCEYCHFQTNFLLHLKKHLTLHTSHFKTKCNFLSYVCQKCNFTTHSMLTVYKHVSDLCSSLKWFRCDQCTFKTPRKEYLIRHKKNKHTPEEDTRWFLCELCPYRTRWKGNLKEHIMARHSERGKKGFECDMCEFSTMWKTALGRHKLRKHSHPKCLKCKDCEFETLRKDSMKRHTTTMHTSKEEAQWFQCDICHLQTRRNDLLKRHRQQVHGLLLPKTSVKVEIPEAPTLSRNEYDLPCALIPKTELFEIPLHLGGYVKIQPRDQLVELPPQEMWFSCDQCPFSAKLQTSLKIHKSSHKKGSDRLVYFKCALCHMQTDRKDNLQRHIRETHGLEA